MRIIYYLPAICTLFAVFMLQEAWLKAVIIALLGMCVVFAKYERSKWSADEIEFDERVSINIRHWSFGFLVVTNAVLILLLLLVSQGIIVKMPPLDYFIVYLVVMLMVALYVIPSVAKKF